MTGGLIQIVAYGTEDLFLTAKPQITFFKVVYRRYTNFSIESIEEHFNGRVDFGETVSCQISKNGDLLHKMYLKVDIPKVTLFKEKNIDKLDNMLLEYNKAVENFNNFDLYSRYIIDCYKLIVDILLPQSTTYLDVYNVCKNYYSNQINIKDTDINFNSLKSNINLGIQKKQIYYY